MLYDDDYTRQCYDCDQKDVQIDNVKYWLQSVIEHLYSDEVLFVADLEHCLDELCRSVKMQLPERAMNYHRKDKTFASKEAIINRDIPIDAWKKWNNEHLKLLVNS